MFTIHTKKLLVVITLCYLTMGISTEQVQTLLLLKKSISAFSKSLYATSFSCTVKEKENGFEI